MGILDVFKRKKDDFNTNPDLGMPLQGQPEPTQGSSPFDQQPGGFQQDPYSTQGYQGYPDQHQPQPQQQQPFSPEQYGFERVPQGQTGFSRGSPPGQSINDINTNKEFELINAKLDAIKSELDSVNQRLKRMERINEGSGTPGKHDAWY